MIRFTDKTSIFLIAAFLALYGYAVFAQDAGIFVIFDHLSQVWNAQLFPMVIIGAAVLVTRLNFVLTWVLVLAGYLLFINWPVEDYQVLLQQLIAPDGTEPNLGMFSSTLAWHGYAFLLMVALVDVLRIAASAIRAANAPAGPEPQGYRR